MPLTATALRSNLYRLLDQVAETGRAVTIERKGCRLKIVREESASRLDGLVRHDCMARDPESLVHDLSLHDPVLHAPLLHDPT